MESGPHPVAGNSADFGRTVTSKVTAILMTFTGVHVLSMTAIAHRAGLPMSTAHRLVNELVAWRILERTDDGHYRVGLPLRMISDQAECAPTLLERAPAVMADLSCATGSDVRLGVLHGVFVDYVEYSATRRPALSSPATTLPAHATALGKALLAFASPGAVELVIANGLRRHTPYTLTTPQRLRRALHETRISRVAVSQSELRLGVSTVAVPVFGVGQHVVAALELQVRDLRREFSATRAALMVAAGSLSREISIGRPDVQPAGSAVGSAGT